MRSLILMAVYNGERFISRQLDSIIAQTDTDWQLIVRDDGSTDATLEILNGYAKKDGRIKILLNKTKKHGAYHNFWALIEHARGLDGYEYCFFSDQDDVWDSDKLEKMISYAENTADGKPLCLYSDMRTIDENDNVMIESMDAVMGTGIKNNACLFFSHGYIWGCTVMVNRQMIENVPMPNLDDDIISILSHDNYFGKCASVIGRLEFLPEQCISHRRYGTNTTGEYKHKLSPEDVIVKGTVGLEKLAQTHAKVYKQTLYAIERMEAAGLTGFDEYKQIIKKGGIRGVLGLKKLGVQRKQRSRTVGIYVVMLLKLYKKYM